MDLETRINFEEETEEEKRTRKGLKILDWYGKRIKREWERDQALVEELIMSRETQFERMVARSTGYLRIGIKYGVPPSVTLGGLTALGYGVILQ